MSSTDTRLARIAADIFEARREHIEDAQDVKWYVAEESGLDEYEAGVVFTLVAEMAGVAE